VQNVSLRGSFERADNPWYLRRENQIVFLAVHAATSCSPFPREPRDASDGPFAQSASYQRDLKARRDIGRWWRVFPLASLSLIVKLAM